MTAAMVVAGGYVLFVGHILQAERTEPEKADGIVALTGASQTRLVDGLALLADGKAERLLISGVYEKATRAEVALATGAPEALFECCVDLGRSAADTAGNATETAAWAQQHQFTKLIVVTDAWHMPRATLEIGAAYPEAKLIPYPVKTAPFDRDDWWKDEATQKRVLLEYWKYLGVLIRLTAARFGIQLGELT